MFYVWLGLGIFTGLWGVGLAVHSFHPRVFGWPWIRTVMYATIFSMLSLASFDAANLITLGA